MGNEVFEEEFFEEITNLVGSRENEKDVKGNIGDGERNRGEETVKEERKEIRGGISFSTYIERNKKYKSRNPALSRP